MDVARVLQTAQLVARAVSADVEAVHVPGDAQTSEGQFAAAAAERAHVALRLLDAPTITAIVDLPGRSGLEVLREIKADPDLAGIPVAILTASDKGEDVQGTRPASSRTQTAWDSAAQSIPT